MFRHCFPSTTTGVEVEGAILAVGADKMVTVGVVIATGVSF
jgi:hypothetical protein